LTPRFIYGDPWLESEVIPILKKSGIRGNFNQDYAEMATSPYIKSGIPGNSGVEY
jgi:hypothetical protein